MVKDESKLRKDLESLFKERGDKTQRSSTNNRINTIKIPRNRGKGPWKVGLNGAKEEKEEIRNGSFDAKPKENRPKKTKEHNNLKSSSPVKQTHSVQKRKTKKKNAINEQTPKETTKKIKQKQEQKENVPKSGKSEEAAPKKRKLRKSNEPAKKKSKFNEERELTKRIHVLGSPYESEMSENEESRDSSEFFDWANDDSYDDFQSTDEYDDSEEFFSSLAEEYSDYSQCDDDFSEDSELDGEDGESSCSDPDYRLPRDVAEDLIIHKGLATTYKLESHHGVEFDEETEHSHLIELPSQSPVKTIEQYDVYNIENLRTQEKRFIERKSVSMLQTNGEDCPDLVPIANHQDDKFDLWASGITMDDEMFSDDELEEVSDDSSVNSHSDVNQKYLKHSSDDDEDDFNGVQRMKSFVFTHGENDEDDPAVNPIQNTIFNHEVQTSLADIINAFNMTSDASSSVEIIKAAIANFDRDSEEDDGQQIDDDEAEQQTFSEHNNCEIDVNLSTDIENDDDDDIRTKTAQNRNVTQIDSSLSEMVEDDAPDETGQKVFEEDYKKKQRILTKFYNSIDSYHVLALLKSPIFIYGTIQVQLIAGSTEIYGYALKKNEMVTLHSPRGCTVVPLKPTPTSSMTIYETEIIADIEALSDEAEFTKRHLNELLSNFDCARDAILLLRRNEAATQIKHIFQKHINENIYPTYIPKSRPFCHTETMLDCMVNGTTAYALQVPQQWHELDFRCDSKFMLVGGKSVGKSTLLRYLINKNLQEFPRILLIDLDIGQPEIFVPQTVSCALIEQPLLGPGFFSQIQPAKAYAVGHTNFTLCAHAYMRAVLSLLEFCKAETAYTNLPWIINTMGYNKGFGAELISIICAHLQLTDIVQLHSNKPINNFDIHFQPYIVGSMKRNIYNGVEYDCSTKNQLNYNLHVIPSAVEQQSRYKQEWQMSAKDMRYIMMLARLSSILPDEGEWINRSETFKKSLEDLHIIDLTARDADKMETLKSLECNLVYLCNNTNDVAIECLGIGIVRGIDYNAKQVYIMPAMPVRKLSYVNCLALGEMPLPGSLLTEQNPEAENSIPFVQVMQDEATSRAVKQFFYRS